MVLFIRDQRNKTIVDLEIISDRDGKVKDIHSIIATEPYSRFLLGNVDRAAEIVPDFEELSNLRGWFFESYSIRNKAAEYSDVLKLLRQVFHNVVSKYDGLYYTED